MSEGKININDLWKEKYPNGKFPESERELVLKFAKQLLELAAENAEIDWNSEHEVSESISGGGYTHYKIDKQSIIDTIKQIE